MTQYRTMIAADHINHLLYPFTTTERVALPVMRKGKPTGKTVLGPYTVRHPGLLDQIEQTVTGSTTAGQVFHAAYGSKPAGRLDCLMFLDRINKQSLQLANKFHLELSPLRSRLGAISGHLGLETNATVAGWWVSARVLTQHDGPPVAPNAPCPNEECDVRGTIRVRFDPNVAMCTHCGRTWSDNEEDENSFGRLAVWVRWASEHLVGPEHWVLLDSLGPMTHCTECELERMVRADRARARLSEIRRAKVSSKRRVS